jgi:hypothetical protein
MFESVMQCLPLLKEVHGILLDSSTGYCMLLLYNVLEVRRLSESVV